MPVYKVNVKWNKQVFNLELNTDEEPRLFKAQLFALTSVSIDRQKVLFKGKQIQDDSWGNVIIKDGVTLLMMGSQDIIPQAPEIKTIFMEDLSDNKLAEYLNLPAGLDNLGNTCYINATVQCLRTVPEFCEKLKSCEPNSSLFIHALKNLYDAMDCKAIVKPNFLVTTLLKEVPRFAENLENGQFAQQDANECWTEILRLLKAELKPFNNPYQDENSPKHNSFIDQYFCGMSDVTLKCIEAEDEKPSVSTESFLQLSCFINTDVKYLHSGLKAKLEEQITKNSPTLNRDATYLKTSKISRLPAYLSIQMVRFYYKEKESINAKILKDIKFTLSLDVYDLCSSELQQKLMPMRSKFKENEDRLCEVKANSIDDKDKDKDKIVDNYVYPTYFKDDLGSNNSGFYELQGVLTHKGRSSSSGHYVAWIRREKNEWFKCDDDNVTQVTEEEILKLSGGGDWHCAYVLLYGPRVLEVDKKSDGTPII